jgi:hypothetical protein
MGIWEYLRAVLELVVKSLILLEIEDRQSSAMLLSISITSYFTD